MTIWAAVVAIVFGGGGVGGYTAFDAVLEMGDDRWVTIASQTQKMIFDTQDELAEIQRRIEQGKETENDRIRKAVLEERLRQLEN